MYLAINCNAVLLFRLLRCFLTSVLQFPMSNYSSGKKKKEKTTTKNTKKAFAFLLFDAPVCICCCFASAILHSSWKGSRLIQGGDAKWLE